MMVKSTKKKAAAYEFQYVFFPFTNFKSQPPPITPTAVPSHYDKPSSSPQCLFYTDIWKIVLCCLRLVARKDICLNTLLPNSVELSTKQGQFSWPKHAVVLHDKVMGWNWNKMNIDYKNDLSEPYGAISRLLRLQPDFLGKVKIKS